MTKGKKLVCLVLVICLIVGMTDAGYAETKQLRMGIAVDEGTLTPYTYTSDPGLELTKLIYDCLFYLDENLEAKPWLVKEYTLSEDSLVYTLKLHENVKWHDGNNLTAEDVKFTYEYVLKHKKSRFTTPASNIQEIKILDTYTLQMVLKTPQPDFLVAPFAELPIMPKHIWEKLDNPNESKERIGSGPYKLVDVQAGQYYKLEANKEFFKGTPAVDEIVISVIKDVTSLFTALKAGELDVANRTISPEILDSFKQDKNLKVSEGPGFAPTLLQFNNERYPFSKKEFRQALTYATNKQEIVDVVMLKAATPGSSAFLHPTLSSYNPDTAKYEFNLQKAAEILDSINFKDADGDGIRESEQGKKLAFDLLVYANNPLRIRIAELLKDYYGKIGVQVNIKAMDMSTVDDLVWPEFEVTKGRDYDMALWGWGASMMNKPTNLKDLFYSDLNIGYVNIGAYKNPEFDKVSDQLDAEYNPEKRKELLFKMQEIVAEDCPIITLYYPIEAYAYNPSVYDGWKYTKGKGIINTLSLVNLDGQAQANSDEAKIDETKEESAFDQGNGGGLSNLWVFGLIIIAAVIFMIVNKKKEAAKR